MRAAVEIDDASAAVEQEEDDARKLLDFVSMPIERFRNAGRRTVGAGLDVFLPGRVEEIGEQLLLLGACPGLKGNLAVHRIAYSAWRALTSRFRRAIGSAVGDTQTLAGVPGD